MARQKPELYDIQMSICELSKEFIQAMTEGLLRMLRQAS